MSAMEGMIKTILKAMDLNPDVIQREVTSRIAAFEGNVKTLNDTLIELNKGVENLRLNQRAICAAQNIPYIEMTANEENENGRRNSLPKIA